MAKLAGCTTESWDNIYGAQFDPMIHKNLRKLYNLLGSGHVVFVWFGVTAVVLLD